MIWCRGNQRRTINKLAWFLNYLKQRFGRKLSTIEVYAKLEKQPSTDDLIEYSLRMRKIAKSNDFEEELLVDGIDDQPDSKSTL